jgi:hypothetical protein
MNKKLLGSAVVGVAILAIVAAQFWGGSDEAPAAAPTTAPPSIVQSSFEAYRFPDVAGGRGWTVEVPVPAGWAVTHDKDRASYRRGDDLLETDRLPITQEDVVSGLQAVAKADSRGGTVTATDPVADLDAAKWDYDFLSKGVPWRGTVVGLGAGDSLITIRYEAPAAEFDRDRGVLDAAMKISAPG